MSINIWFDSKFKTTETIFQNKLHNASLREKVKNLDKSHLFLQEIFKQNIAFHPRRKQINCEQNC